MPCPNARGTPRAKLSLATVIAYVDRGILGLIERDLERTIGFTTVEYGYILGGAPSELATPRLFAPRKHVPEGSVAIGRRAKSQAAAAARQEQRVRLSTRSNSAGGLGGSRIDPVSESL